MGILKGKGLGLRVFGLVVLRLGLGGLGVWGKVQGLRFVFRVSGKFRV